MEIIEKEEEVGSIKKTFFVTRIFAYIIDFLLISVICTALFMVFPKSEEHNVYREEYRKLGENLVDKKITSKEYSNESIDLVYKINRSSVFTIAAETIVLLGYFSFFQFQKKGQTIGKKLLKIKVISADLEKKPTLINYIVRTLIIHSVLVNIFLIFTVIFFNKEWYYYSNLILQGLSTLLVIVSILMISFRKDGRGLHDILGKTKVIRF